MPLGPGKYDDLATLVRERSGAGIAGGPCGVIVIVIGGEKGDGFSCQADLATTLALPAMLENIAKEIRESSTP